MPVCQKLSGIRQVQARSIFVLPQVDEFNPVSYFGLRDSFEQLRAAGIRLDHQKDFFESGKMICVSQLLPLSSAGQAKRWQIVVPEGMTVALALDQDDIVTPLGKPPDAVEAQPAGSSPGEFARAVKRQAKPYRRLRSGFVEVGNSNDGTSRALGISQSQVPQEAQRDLFPV